jgi:protoporphyrinogen IX oxidase
MRPGFARKRRVDRSLVVVWVLGMLLAVNTGAFAQGWFLVKLLLVMGLSGYHFWMASYAAQLAHGVRSLDGRKLRLVNEVPGIAAAVIVVLVVVRPF